MVKLKLMRGFSLENLQLTYVSCFYRYLMTIITWYGAVDCGCTMLPNLFIFGTNYIGSLRKCFDFFLHEGLWKHLSSCDYTCSNPDQTVWESPGYFNENERAAESYYFGSIIFIIPTKHLKRAKQKAVCDSFDWRRKKPKTHRRFNIFGSNHY